MKFKEKVSVMYRGEIKDLIVQGRKIIALSLFSGGGGLDLGFSSAGYSICASVDIDPYSCKTLEINANKKAYYQKPKIINEDITRLPTVKITSKIDRDIKNIDIVIGGPPCQAFSVFGRRKGLDDPRAKLVWEYLRIIRDISPTAFLFENVDGLKTIHNGELFQEILEALSINGKYTISNYTYNLANFGIPQNRNRVFLIGVKNGKKIPSLTETHGNNGSQGDKLPFVIVRKALSGMDAPGTNSMIPNHIGRKHSNRIIQRYAGLEFGERDHKTRINKLHPDKPSFTIIVGSDAGGGKGHIHPFEPREVTPRESARIQTFPDWWEFYGKGRHVIRQVGNAVPPLFSALLADHVKKHIFETNRKTSYKQFISKLELAYLN